MKTHLAYLFVILVLILSGWAWLREHDARLLAEQQARLSEHVISDLKSQMVATDTATKQKTDQVAKIVKQAKTAAQVVASIPRLTQVPLNARVLPSQEVAVQAPALEELLGKCRTDAIEVTACQLNLDREKQIETEQGKEIALYKKAAGHKTFLGKVWGGMKQVGLLGIGIALGKVI